MTERPARSKSADHGVPALRRLAEQLVLGQDALRQQNPSAIDSQQAQVALHELRVHQIELEMQNDELRNAQLELDASRERYFDLYELAPVGYCTVSAQGLLLQANLAAADLLGRNRTSLLHKPITRFIFQADQDAYYLHCQQLGTPNPPNPVDACDIRLVKGDGSLVWVHLRASAAHEANGAPTLRLVLSDITARKQAELRLGQSQAFNQAVLDSVQDEIAVLDPNGFILAVNAPWRRFASAGGIAPEHGAAVVDVGANYLAVCQASAHAASPEAALAHAGIQGVLNRSLPRFTMECACSTPDRERWFCMTVTPLLSAPGGAVVAHTDITARVQAQANLRWNEERYRSLFESSRDALMLTTSEGDILKANSAACALFDYTEDELCRLGRSGVIDSGDLRLAAALQERARTGKFFGELTMVCKNGRRFAGEVSSATFQGSNGEARNSVAVRDITERLRAQAALRDNARQLQALSARVLAVQEAERRRVALELHDELGQALTAIKINLQLPSPSQTQQALHAENLRIVDDALQQVRRLAQALRPSMLDDLGLVPALRWLGEQAAARSGFAFHLHGELPPERLASDTETACFRIVQEALTNVARYAQATQVQVDVQVDVQSDGTNHLLLCVQDDGVGFDPATARRPDPHHGDGMGLLGMRERASLIGGTLQVESAPGQGCRLRVRCPLRLRGAAP